MKEILLSACGAFVFVHMVQFQMIFKINFKPFNCANCMAGWFCLMISAESNYWMEVPFMMAASMMVAALFTSIMKRL